MGLRFIGVYGRDPETFTQGMILCRNYIVNYDGKQFAQTWTKRTAEIVAATLQNLGEKDVEIVYEERYNIPDGVIALARGVNYVAECDAGIDYAIYGKRPSKKPLP
jgi:hypothetical protein